MTVSEPWDSGQSHWGPAVPLRELPVHAEAADSGRPIPAGRIAPKRPDGEPLIFLFRFYEAAVRDLTDPARSGPSRSSAIR